MNLFKVFAFIFFFSIGSIFAQKGSTIELKGRASYYSDDFHGKRTASGEKFDVNKIPSFDLEYIFINLRSKSVNNIVGITLKDNEDQKEYTFDVNLDEVKIVNKENHNKKISIMDDLGVVMRYPNFDESNMIFQNHEDSDPVTDMIKMISQCMDVIYQGERLYKAEEDFDKTEALAFINDLPIESIDKFKDFFDNFPEIEYVINYKNSLGNDRSYRLTGINSFFF
jgi:hypothetical protein